MKRIKDGGGGTGDDESGPGSQQPITKYFKTDEGSTSNAPEVSVAKSDAKEGNNNKVFKTAYSAWKDETKSKSPHSQVSKAGASSSDSSQYDFQDFSSGNNSKSSTPSSSSKKKMIDHDFVVPFVHFEQDEMIFQFINFAGIERQGHPRRKKPNEIFSKPRFNPYDASISNVTDFLHYLIATNNTEIPAPILESYKHALAKFLPDMKEEILSISENFLSETEVTFKLDHSSRIYLNGLAVYPQGSRTTSGGFWNHFREYCLSKNYDIFTLDTRKMSRYILSVFKDVRDEKLDLGSFVGKPSVPVYNLYTFFVEKFTSASQVFHRDLITAGNILQEDEHMKKVHDLAVALDQNLISNEEALVYLPSTHYTKIRLTKGEDAFWESSITKDLLRMVEKKVVPIYCAAKELGVTSEMLYHGMRVDDPCPPEELPSLVEFTSSGLRNSSEKRYWSRGFMTSVLEDVRNRRLTVEEIAAKVGVSRREVKERVGSIKTAEELEKEKTDERIRIYEEKEKMRENKPKKPTQLEEQIKMAESKEDELSEYELLRLRNLKERQALMIRLNMEEDKKELKKINQVERIKREPKEEVVMRERSSRIKKKMELDRLKQNHNDDSYARTRFRTASNSLGLQMKIPMNYTEEAITKSSQVPKFDLLADQLLEITSDYRKSGIFLHSISQECSEMESTESPVSRSETDWSGWVFKTERIVSSSPISCLDSFQDITCYGTRAGGVGVMLAGRSATIRPHNDQVTGLVMEDTKVVSSSEDGTVRMTDWMSQKVTLEHSWDTAQLTRSGVLGIKSLDQTNYLIDVGHSVAVCDTRISRSRVITDLRQSGIQGWESYCAISVEPRKKSHFSVTRDNVVQVYDVRRSSQPVFEYKVQGYWRGNIIQSSGWNCTGSLYSLVYSSSAMSQKTKIFSATKRATSACCSPGDKDNNLDLPSLEAKRRVLGNIWCPWQESSFLSTKQKFKAQETILTLSSCEK